MIEANKPIEAGKPKRGYTLRNRIQGILWLAGLPVHNRIDEECCPDFSCCTISSTPFKVRLTYLFRRWVTEPLRPIYFRIFHPKVSQIRLCSGYRVFPGGETCPGCLDCYKRGR